MPPGLTVNSFEQKRRLDRLRVEESGGGLQAIRARNEALQRERDEKRNPAEGT